MSEFHQRYRDVSRHGFTVEELGITEVARLNSIVNLVPRTVETILDVGCGEGLITNPLGQMGFSITGCDISFPSLQYVNSSKTQATLEILPFKDDSFDLVVCTSVFEHLPGDLLYQSVSEFQRVARQYILICVPYKEMLWKSLTRCPNCGSIYHKNLHLHSFDEQKLASFLPDVSQVGISYAANQDWKSDSLVWIGQRIFNRYAYSISEVKCPICGIVFSHNVGMNEKRRNQRITGLAERIAKGINHIFRYLTWFSPERPTHMAMLFNIHSN